MAIFEEQLKDEDLQKIIHRFDNDDKDVNHANWLERGYLMNQGVLYRYSLTLKVIKLNGNYQRIAKLYFWIGMRKFITNYAKNCLHCARFKASNQKSAGLLQTPVQAQRFAIIAIDLFCPLPESKDKKKWIFVVEDVPLDG
ncbi:hypothetical protein AVEN_241905-1 [Araneus ventricosus]|uniref:Integrase zinc-binding domain-containing protein n=1 Tax=Araneus ventricosus TaxID=182803 RepID=A0A4Y2RTY2_ARAVE|nr:hypothetical protein AVEN_241905-1 [Araneus ventricosus]